MSENPFLHCPMCHYKVGVMQDRSSHEDYWRCMRSEVEGVDWENKEKPFCIFFISLARGRRLLSNCKNNRKDATERLMNVAIREGFYLGQYYGHPVTRTKVNELIDIKIEKLKEEIASLNQRKEDED